MGKRDYWIDVSKKQIKIIYIENMGQSIRV